MRWCDGCGQPRLSAEILDEESGGFEGRPRGSYVHGRRDSADGRVDILLRFEQAKLWSKLVAAQRLALADWGHVGDSTVAQACGCLCSMSFHMLSEGTGGWDLRARGLSNAKVVETRRHEEHFESQLEKSIVPRRGPTASAPALGEG